MIQFDQFDKDKVSIFFNAFYINIIFTVRTPSKGEVISFYKNSCQKQRTKPIEKVLKQIQVLCFFFAFNLLHKHVKIIHSTFVFFLFEGHSRSFNASKYTCFERLVLNIIIMILFYCAGELRYICFQ